MFRQSIESTWGFSCRAVHFHQELVPFEVVYRKQILYIDVGHIVVILVWDAGDVQALLSHILESIYQHNLLCNSNQWSIQDNYDPPSRSILRSAF